MKNKKPIIFLIFLLVIAAAIMYFFYYKKNISKINYSLQGNTVIHYGTIKLNIWDNNTEDGDSVKVYLDNKLVRDTIALQYQPLMLNFGKLNKGEHLLGVVAINEGATSPASATMSLSNESEQIEFEMNATKDSAATWKIIVQ